MEATSAGRLSILRDHVWRTGLQWYDLLQVIRFGTDGWGIVMRGAGQHNNLEARFRYSLPEPGRLDLEFFDTPSCSSPERLAFKRTESNAHLEVRFDLIPGRHEAACQTMDGMVRRGFPWLLRFDPAPYRSVTSGLSRCWTTMGALSEPMRPA
jgi:hypothetical protein